MHCSATRLSLLFRREECGDVIQLLLGIDRVRVPGCQCSAGEQHVSSSHSPSLFCSGTAEKRREFPLEQRLGILDDDVGES